MQTQPPRDDDRITGTTVALAALIVAGFVGAGVLLMSDDLFSGADTQPADVVAPAVREAPGAAVNPEGEPAEPDQTSLREAVSEASYTVTIATIDSGELARERAAKRERERKRKPEGGIEVESGSSSKRDVPTNDDAKREIRDKAQKVMEKLSNTEKSGLPVGR